jgi:hypothetical protein
MEDSPSHALNATQSWIPLSVSPRSLAAAFAQAPDPRRAASVTYSRPALPTLAVASFSQNGCARLRGGVPVSRGANTTLPSSHDLAG